MQALFGKSTITDEVTVGPEAVRVAWGVGGVARTVRATAAAVGSSAGLRGAWPWGWGVKYIYIYTYIYI